MKRRSLRSFTFICANMKEEVDLQSAAKDVGKGRIIIRWWISYEGGGDCGENRKC